MLEESRMFRRLAGMRRALPTKYLYRACPSDTTPLLRELRRHSMTTMTTTSMAMARFYLPAELEDMVIRFYVNTYGVRDAWKIRAVCSKFSSGGHAYTSLQKYV
jgi:hypothetical protein